MRARTRTQSGLLGSATLGDSSDESSGDEPYDPGFWWSHVVLPQDVAGADLTEEGGEYFPIYADDEGNQLDSALPVELLRHAMMESLAVEGVPFRATTPPETGNQFPDYQVPVVPVVLEPEDVLAIVQDWITYHVENTQLYTGQEEIWSEVSDSLALLTTGDLDWPRGGPASIIKFNVGAADDAGEDSSPEQTPGREVRDTSPRRGGEGQDDGEQGDDEGGNPDLAPGGYSATHPPDPTRESSSRDAPDVLYIPALGIFVPDKVWNEGTCDHDQGVVHVPKRFTPYDRAGCYEWRDVTPSEVFVPALGTFSLDDYIGIEGCQPWQVYVPPEADPNGQGGCYDYMEITNDGPVWPQQGGPEGSPEGSPGGNQPSLPAEGRQTGRVKHPLQRGGQGNGSAPGGTAQAAGISTWTALALGGAAVSALALSLNNRR